MNDDFKGDLVLSYDTDAPARENRGLPAGRDPLRRQFIELLQREGRSSLVEFGCGVGYDAAGFRGAGLDVVALDLSPGNVELCRSKGIDARVGDFYDLDLADRSFDCGWAMSSLLHVPNADIDGVLGEMARVLVPCAPIGIGVWGGADQEGVMEDDWAEPPRFYSGRSDAHWKEILERHFTVESFQTVMHDEARSGHYQWVVVRTPA